MFAYLGDAIELRAVRALRFYGRVRGLGKLEQLLRRAAAAERRRRPHVELLGGELADRLQHPEAVASLAADEALVDERLRAVDVRVADRFGRLERAAAAEDGEPREEPLLLRRRAGRRTTRSSRAGSADAARRRGRRLSRSSRLPEPLEELLRRQHSVSRGRELEREREVVEPRAQLVDARRRLEAGSRPRARATKSSTASARSSDGTGVRVLALRRAAAPCSSRARRARGHALEQRATTSWRRVDRGARSCRAGAAAACRARLGDVVLALRALCARSPASDELRVAQRRERHPPDAVRVVLGDLGRRLQRKPRLARSAGPGQRQQPDVVAAQQARALRQARARGRGTASPERAGSSA